ncbi:Protein FAM73B [Microtus ochrogaster]|uniref:Mitoguardin 2 n=1 Tax=Microtus ochrogaster TaxID=79684 RepID=A0A8J6G6E8_MICOH|nr:Protein FAM73B [Microtus ochrogaster]
MPASDASFFMLKSMARPYAGPPRRPQRSRQPPAPPGAPCSHPAHLLPAPALCARAEGGQSSAGRGRADQGGARGGALLVALLPPALSNGLILLKQKLTIANTWCKFSLWKDLLLCVPLSCWHVGGAQDPARDQLKTLEALTPRVPDSGAWSAMAFRRTEGMSMIQALAMTVAEIPVFLYTTFGQSAFSQLRLTPGLRKVLFATALGTVALALAAHQLKRRRRKKKQVGPELGGEQLGTVPLPILMARKVPSVKKGYSSRRVQSPSSKSNDTLSGISSIEPSRHSGSSHSLASVRSQGGICVVQMVVVNSSSPTAACSGSWETRGMEESVPTTNGSAESLYVQGMELFEEALQKWEQALSVGQRGDGGSTPTPGDSFQNLDTSSEAPSEPESQRREFAEKLESLLHRAYHLQEEFGSTFPSDSMLLDLERTLMLPLTEGSLRLRADDEDSLTSEDSFFSATELFESLQVGDYPLPLSRPAAAYEEALQLVKEGKVPCRTLRTELLGCYSDQDFLAKLHCVRQAFEGLLEERDNQVFFGEVGRQMVTGLMTRAEKGLSPNQNRLCFSQSPKGFLESYEEMLSYALRPETWATTRLELEGRGVACMSFFDIVLDFILMDAFEDLENPPSSVLAVLRNRWLSDSFKETALATACWSVLKAKRRLLMVPDGFISHFYSVSEHVSPVLAFGFLGPKPQLAEVCAFFKHQIVQYLRDMFDLDNVRYTSVPALADDILQLSRRRSEILLGYLGTPVASSTGLNGPVPRENGPLEELQ